MWELIFLMVIMKIPIVYLCWVVYWAIKSGPVPDDGTALVARGDGPGYDPDPRFRRARRNRPPRPHGGPTRAYPRTARAAVARSPR